ncbi:glutathione S-transferase N-terminal domain-containing protein [Alphaproteobacteria bacterium KMM 3653]|uniref:Glutathione S-transferase N-terminal domain-containing protein n=1 Tax=Harenicola maris TaxID=2841044 RepID=A0AAP2G2R9_9RHOB|nr:glutathione S-transferase N-terminal domain-containing protein [Harenicola maris]
MTYTLYIGDRSYSSWSLRGWLLFEKFDLACKLEHVDFAAASVAEQIKTIAPATTVPALLCDDGSILGDSLAMAEELASRHPDRPFWPAAPRERAAARYLTSQMHCAFGDLRGECPMNLRTAYAEMPAHEGVQSDLRRLEALWDHAFALGSAGGPWLFGDYSIADAFFAPVAARIAGYGLQVGAAAQAYVAAHLADPAFRRWRAMGLAKGETLPWYKKDFPQAPWPGPAPFAASLAEGPSENDTCPYSGDAVSDFLEIDGRVFGFCNAFCRDKTLHDPLAWPAFAALL